MFLCSVIDILNCRGIFYTVLWEGAFTRTHLAEPYRVVPVSGGGRGLQKIIIFSVWRLGKGGGEKNNIKIAVTKVAGKLAKRTGAGRGRVMSAVGGVAGGKEGAQPSLFIYNIIMIFFFL